jgi:uncharacterized protein (DUF1697 family)
MRAVGLSATDANPQWWMAGHGPAAVRAAERVGLATERVLAHDLAPLGARELVALHHLGEDGVTGDTLSAITDHERADAVQHAFDVFGIDSPSSHTRSKLEAWLTAQRADNNAWTNWTFINLLTLVMLSPEMNLA